MSDKEIIQALNKVARLLNKVHEEAVLRYGNDAQIFFDEGGIFNVMDGDQNFNSEDRANRHDYVQFSSTVRAKVTGGAW
jgi:hypothetical protein